jgi:predicted nucleic acid-binding protein
MVFKVFLDVNMLLDFTLKRAAYAKCKQIIELIVTNQIKAYTTPSIIHIMGYWLTKAYGSATAKKVIIALLTDVQIIDITHELAITALHSKINDIEDALQYYTAIHYKLDYFISGDKQLKKAAIPILPVCTPEEFLKKML